MRKISILLLAGVFVLITLTACCRHLDKSEPPIRTNKEKHIETIDPPPAEVR